jgi:hypothetical protein
VSRLQAFSVFALGCLPGSLFGYFFALHRATEEVQAGFAIFQDMTATGLQAVESSRASTVEALLEGLAALHASDEEAAVAQLQATLHHQARLLELRLEGRPEPSPHSSQVLARANSYIRDHELPEVAARPGRSPFSQAIVLPDYQGGKLRGLRISGLLEQSYLASLGVKNRDVIVSVDGTGLSSMADAADALRLIEAQPPDLALEVLRDGQKSRLTRPK